MDNKRIVVYFIFVVNFIYITFSATVKREYENENVPGDLSIVASDDVPEISRKDLMEIIKKSQYFQDIFFEQPDPTTIQFGHVCENPNEWEQRFEQRDFKNNHFQGKMRWGNKNGDYGEHYWDLGHAGN